MVYTFYSPTFCCRDFLFMFQFFFCWITWSCTWIWWIWKNKKLCTHLINQTQARLKFLNTYAIWVLTISISKRIFCLLLASLKKSLERREICRKEIHGKSLLIFLIHLCWMTCKQTWIHVNSSSLITIIFFFLFFFEN